MPANSEIDRSNLSRCLSKAIAFAQTGQQEKASSWSLQLIQELVNNDLLSWEDVQEEVEKHA